MELDDLTSVILNCAFQIHSDLGPGLLERAYKECLAYELTSKGLSIQVEKPMPLIYKEIVMECGYRIDILVEDKIVVELKTVEEFNEIHIAQTLTYMRLSGCKIGLLLNFNTKSLKNGIKRLVL